MESRKASGIHWTLMGNSSRFDMKSIPHTRREEMSRNVNTKKKSIVAYKGFDNELKCQGFEFEVGKTYKHKGKTISYKSGFDSCEYPLDVLNYYGPVNNRFAIVKASGEIIDRASKIISSTLTVKEEIDLHTLVRHAVDWITQRLDESILQIVINSDKSAATNGNYSVSANIGGYSSVTNTGNYSVATNTGNYSSVTNTGDYSASTNTGDHSVSTNTGQCSVSTNTGHWSVSTNTGYRSASINTGNYSASANTGYRSASINIGDNSVAINTSECSVSMNAGCKSVATNTGNFSAAMNTGDWSTSTNTGNFSTAMNIGDKSDAEVTGSDSIAVSLGIKSRARANAGGAIVLCYRDEEGHLIHIRASKVGENGVKEGVWYSLDANGQFIEV